MKAMPFTDRSLIQGQLQNVALWVRLKSLSLQGIMGCCSCYNIHIYIYIYIYKFKDINFIEQSRVSTQNARMDKNRAFSIITKVIALRMRKKYSFRKGEKKKGKDLCCKILL